MGERFDSEDGAAVRRANASLTAALVGGAAAASAGAFWSARAIARRNGAGDGRDLNPVMKTAATACELAHGETAEHRR